MSKPKILFTCQIADADAKRRIERCAEVIEIAEATEAAVLAHLDGVEGVIVPFTQQQVITHAVLDQGRDLKLVGTTYGGTRQNVDDRYALEKGLVVIHTGASRPRPMAEFTLVLVLSSLMHIHAFHHAMRSGEAWPRFKFPRGRILQGRAVGIIGLGLIGEGLLDLLRPFTDRLFVSSRHLSDEDSRRKGVERLELDDLFARCEVVILAGGYTPATHHLIRKRHFERMPPGGLFVNIARGKMVHEQEMIEALAQRDIYLALDVFEEEPLPADSPLRASDRVLLVPHRGNNAIEFEQRWQCLADEIERFCAGERPHSALTLERLDTMSES
jgi:D-3-phosphoglycerate dehydrogenase / 2-oxoglutarate reductase